MKTILSIQSHVAAGYVGNRAAVFPLQRMGYEVIFINTVQYSNHTGYGEWTGKVFEDDHIKDVLKGIEQRGLYEQIDGVLSGYLGDARLGKIILNAVEKIRALNPDLLYCCDPVMGDTGRGLFVREGIPDFFYEQAVAKASLLTPNLFELQTLTERQITSLDDARKACLDLHGRGPQLILVTSLETPEIGDEEIGMLASHKNGGQWLVTTKKVALDPAPNGAGDLTAALFTGHLLADETIEHALRKTAASLLHIFKETKQHNRRELALIHTQESFMDAREPVEITKLR